MPRPVVVVLALACCGTFLAPASAQSFRPSQQTAVAEVDKLAGELKQTNRSIWEWAELGLQEHRSAKLLADRLERAGFKLTRGVAGMPTAFVAEWGSGRPVIGILAEYDALPGMSQKVVPRREPLKSGAPGHACGHSALGTAAVGAALAIKEAMQKHNIRGTLRLYGTPAEETGIGKVYMTLAGVFDDLDVCLHWHPSTANGVWDGSSKALVSAKFTFYGLPAHASVSPEAGRSALDAVELMNVGANYMREHLKEDARLHYVIIDGGGAPNVVPPKATVWYFVRADRHEDVEYNFRWLQDVAKGAAMMTRTRLEIQVDTDCHEIIPNRPLSELIHRNMVRLGPPRFTEEEKLFARRLQEPLVREFGKQFPQALHEGVDPLEPNPKPSKGSTDVGDISWHVPTGGFRTACMPVGSPGHSWQNVAAIGSSIGEKGLVYAAKVFAVTALDLFEEPRWIAAAKQDFARRTQGRKYFSFVPKGQKPPRRIR